MSFIKTVQCRLRQAMLRPGRQITPSGLQTVEDGPGAVFSAAQMLRTNRLKKPLVVVGQGGELWVGRLTHALEESDVEFAVWDELPPDPTVEDAERLRRAWITEECDSFIALGDGAVVDAVKAASAGAAFRTRTILSLVGAGRIRKKNLPPVMAIPVVAGAGTESTSWATVADEQGGNFVLEDRALLPAYVILDPELLGQMTRETLARAVAEGLCLSVEAYLSGYGTDASRMLAAEALGELVQAAEPCWNSGGTMSQRSKLLSASHKAGTAATAAGVGYVRALSRSVQRVCGGRESEIAAVVLPAVMEKYGNTARRALASLASGAGIADSGTVSEKADALIQRLRQMTFLLGLPEYLENVSDSAAEEIADLAAAEANPRYACPVVWSADDLVAVIKPLCAAENRI